MCLLKLVTLFHFLQWEELYSGKPDDQYEDPGDVKAIKEAQENMGDYKLKSASDYVVPDHLRMNVDKAKQRLLVLKDMVRLNSSLCLHHFGDWRHYIVR